LLSVLLLLLLLLLQVAQAFSRCLARLQLQPA
jgi:hypothetical protein